MKALEQPDSFHLRAASGWLELGDHVSANDELETITPSLRAHPAVLSVRYAIYAKAGKWEGAVEIANSLTKLLPTEAGPWVSLAYAVRRRPGGGIPEAKAILEKAVKRFPAEGHIPYNLASYCAQLGELERAKEWLHKAYEVGDAKAYKTMALSDPDLEPLWGKIEQGADERD